MRVSGRSHRRRTGHWTSGGSGCLRFVKAQLYEISGANPIIMVAAIATLAIAAAIAALIPAQRAATINPVQALRSE